MTVLSGEDRSIVEATLRDITSRDVPRLRSIHEEKLAGSRRRRDWLERELAATNRAIAMRELSLVRLGEIAP